jgi:hypothetical protein
MVLEELKMPLLNHGRQPERVYLVLQKHERQVYVSSSDEDVEQQLEGLMSDMWVPLGLVAFYAETPQPVVSPLNWYADLLVRDEQKYMQLCRTVSECLGEASRRLTHELSETRVIPRIH